MEETIESLVEQRDEILREMNKVGYFRRGTVSVIYRKCGKKNCACAKEGHPGHGPVYLWNATIKSKSYAKNLKLGPELDKYIEETNNYKKYVALFDEFVLINERICSLRPVKEIGDDQTLTELKKKLKNLFREKYKTK